jgi:hypothetical protein
MEPWEAGVSVTERVLLLLCSSLAVAANAALSGNLTVSRDANVHHNCMARATKGSMQAKAQEGRLQFVALTCSM